jgi:hypothetical protein
MGCLTPSSSSLRPARVGGGAELHPGAESWASRRYRPGAELMWLGCVVGLSVATVVVALRWRWFVHPDWRIARAAGRDMLHGAGFDVYGRHPDAQMGPLALVLAQLPRTLYIVGVAGAVAVPLLCLTPLILNRSAGPGPTLPRRLLTGCCCGVLCVLPWSQLAWKGHADDALVLVGGATCLAAWSSQHRHAWPVSLCGLAVALAGKPTGVLFAPAVICSPQAALAVITVGSVIWGPFAVANGHALLSAGRGVMPVARGSLPNLLGDPLGGRPPAWVRSGQLVGGLAMAAAGAWRRHPGEGATLAFICRAALDPSPAPAYSIPLVVLCAGPDVGRGMPTRTALAFVSWKLSQPVLAGGSGVPRLVSLLILAAVVTTRPGLAGNVR